MRATYWLIGLVAMAVPAAADGLAVKTGLWEITVAGNAPPPSQTPQLSDDQLSKLTPQQRAMVQQRLAIYASRAAAPKVRKICVTQAMLDKGFNAGDVDAHCTRTPVTNSASVVESSIVCTGEHPATGSFRIEATDPQNVTSTFDLSATMKDGKVLPIHRAMQGKWLADDCGDVKPRE